MSVQAPIDEMVDGTGRLRPQWRGILGALNGLSDTLADRMKRLDLAFEEEGVTSVLPGANAADPAWRCDPVPLVLAADEFLRLEAGLTQRARLIEAVLVDLYGKQSLLADGTIPPALVFANPDFLRLPQGEVATPMLTSYAADLLRGPDGAWQVISDRTNAPSGMGYARENRRLLNRIVPEAFLPVQVRPLRPFFEVWQSSLQHAVSTERGNPAVALLTAGTGHPQWFEDMYLARELACALVEAGDLTVRGGAVFLKTLKGLQAVDVIMRRIDGRAIDPLELDHAGGLGVAGLLDAMRAGKLRIVNDPGTGLAEAPALAAFLPEICERLFGEPLAMQSVPTVWLGDAGSRARVERDPSAWLLRPAMDGGVPATVVHALPEPEQRTLMSQVAARPWAWAATSAIAPSCAPCVGEAGLVPRPIVLRVFMVHGANGWQAMEGGLARVLDDRHPIAGRLPAGGVSKDVWVLNEDRSEIVGPPVAMIPPLRIKRTYGDLPSRVADDMFWLGRYVERLDRAARLTRAAISRLARSGTLLPREIVELQILARCLVEAGLLPAEVAPSAASTGEFTRALQGCVRDRGTVDVIFGEVARLTEAVRDRLTGDMYATFTQTLRSAHKAARGAGRSLDALSGGMLAAFRFAAAVSGIAAENMVRGGGFLFLDLGRRLERARAVAAEVSAAIDQPPPRIELGLRLALELCDSAITYRNRYLNVLQPGPVLDLVLSDPSNPRGLAFQLTAAHTLLDELASGTGGRERLPQVAAGLLTESDMLVDAVLAASDQSVAASEHAARLKEIGKGVANLSDLITRRYFALLPAVQTVGWVDEPADLRGAA